MGFVKFDKLKIPEGQKNRSFALQKLIFPQSYLRKHLLILGAFKKTDL